MPSVISGDANVSATEFGFLDGVTSSLQSQIDSKLPLAGGKILQIVRATDSTDRTTTSTTFVDANISVTITPQKSDSAILLIATHLMDHDRTGDFTSMVTAITDSSNNIISNSQSNSRFRAVGATAMEARHTNVVIAYDTPATTSATTYKLRFRGGAGSTTAELLNSSQTGQLFAIEVSA